MKAKKTLAGMAFFMGTAQLSIGGSAMAQSGVDLQALKLLQENRISKDEFFKLMKHDDPGSYSNESITAGSYSNESITAGSYSNESITAGSYSNESITAGSYSNESITGSGFIINRDGLKLPQPQMGEGIGD